MMRNYRKSIILRFAALLMCAAWIFSAPAFGAQGGTPAKKTAKRPAAKKKPARRPVRRRKPRPRAQRAPTPARITEIQSALATEGVYKAQPNGKWDSTTIQAMKDFQSSHGLAPTGKLDALSLQKLGLGSEIAGRAAPLPLPQTQTGADPDPSTQRETP
jgi:peptidoglycan hydrolase-like protein with peptidoglycan-binding domain